MRPRHAMGMRPSGHFVRVRRRIGVGLLVIAAAMTIWSLSRPGGAGPDEGASPIASAPHACGVDAPVGATAVTLPRARADAWDALVGAIVCVAQPLVVTEVYELGRSGDLLLADHRLFATGTGLEVAEPSLHVVRLSPREAPRAGEALPWGLELGAIRVGDGAHGVAGRLERAQGGGYRIVGAGAPTFLVRNPRPPLPPDVGGDVRVAAFNVFNYFATVGARGARDAAELATQTRKLVSALAPLDADLLALIEIENDDGRALDALAAALNAALRASGSERRYVAAPRAPEGSGGDAIRQAFLYDPARLAVQAVAADPDRVHLRPPQAVTVRPVDGGASVTVIAVHHRSKGSCPTAGDVDAGYGCWNLLRSAQSDAVIRFAAHVSAAAGSDGVLVVGDFNAHRFEPPVTLFEARAGDTPQAWEVLTDRVPEEEAYSYVFFGRSAALDHAIVSTSLASRVDGVAYWAINADEPPAADYRGRPGARTAPDTGPFRSSDHDPVLVGLSAP